MQKCIFSGDIQQLLMWTKFDPQQQALVLSQSIKTTASNHPQSYCDVHYKEEKKNSRLQLICAIIFR